MRRHDRNHHYTFLACANTSSSIFAQVFRDYCVVIITCSSHEPGTGSFYLFGGSCLGTTGLESRAATGCGGGLRRRGGVGERRRKHLPSLFTSLGDGRGMERREKSVPSVHYRNLSYQISNIHMNTVACPSVGGCGVKRGREINLIHSVNLLFDVPTHIHTQLEFCHSFPVNSQKIYFPFPAHSHSFLKTHSTTYSSTNR